MMKRSIIIALFLLSVVTESQALLKARTVQDTGQKIWVRIQADQFTTVLFPAPLTRQMFPVSSEIATFSTTPEHPRRLVIRGVKPTQTQHEFSVSTTQGSYLLVLRGAKKEADSGVTIKRAAPPVLPTHPEADSAEVVRQFWLSQWWNRSLEPGIRIQVVTGFAALQEGQETEYVAYQEGLGLYGWTLRVKNTSDTPQVVDIESITDVSGRLISVIPQSPSGSAGMGQLEPGESVLLHLAYEGVRR